MKLISPSHPEIEDVEDAVLYYYENKHYSIHKIARYLDIPYYTIRRFLLRAGVELRKYKTRTTASTRICKGCGQELPLTEEYYHHDSRAARGFRYYCRDCRHMGMGI